jgi:uncharacterized membrane protein YidH (DUF202 family)
MSVAARDPGLQGERTSLAWSRTALACAVAATLVARDGLVTASPPLTGVGVALLLAAAAMGFGARHRQRAIERDVAAGRSPVHLLTIRLVSGLTLLAGVAVLWAVAASAYAART